jgi:hypothetical protein
MGFFFFNELSSQNFQTTRMILAITLIASALAQQQPTFPNCFSTLATTSVFGLNFPLQRLSSQMIRDGDLLRSDGLVQLSPSESQLQTTIFEKKSTAFIANWLNGTVTCDQMSSTSNTTQFFDFVNMQLVGKKDYAGVTCNVWSCQQNCTSGPGSSLELWLDVTSSDSVPVLVRVTFANGPTQEVVFSGFQVCKSVDPSLFVVPPHLKCRQQTAVVNQNQRPMPF